MSRLWPWQRIPTKANKLAGQAIGAIKDQRTQRAIYRRILALQEDAHLQGAALVGDLAGYRSVRSGGQRYRIVYRIVEVERLVSR